MISIQDAIAEYTLILRANGRSENTVKWYVSILGAVTSEIGNPTVTEVTSTDMAGYITELRGRSTRYQDAPQRPPVSGGLSKYSTESHIRALRAFWGWVTTEYQLDRNPMRNIKPKKLPPPPPKAIQPRDVIRLLESCDDSPAGIRDRAMVLFLMDTGARVGGLVSVQIPLLDLTKRWAEVTEKADKKRRVFMTRYTATMIQSWLNQRESSSNHVFTSVRTGEPLTTSGVYQSLKRLAHVAGVRSAYNPHAFRDGFALAFIKAGGDISTLARLLGHEDVKVTADHYALFADDELQTLKDEVNPLGEVLNTAISS